MTCIGFLLWLIVLLVQSLPQLVALLMSIIRAWPKISVKLACGDFCADDKSNRQAGCLNYQSSNESVCVMRYSVNRIAGLWQLICIMAYGLKTRLSYIYKM